MLQKLISFIDKYRHELWFKYVAIIGILVIGAIGLQIYSSVNTPQTVNTAENAAVEEMEGENPSNTAKPKKKGFIESLWDSIKWHLLIFAGLALALGIVRYIKSVRLKERSERRE